MRCGRSRRALARRLLPVFVWGMGGGISFCASGGVLFPHGESTPPEAEHAVHLPIRAKTQKFPHNKNRTDKSCNSCPSCFQNQKTLQCPPPAIIFSPCPSAGSTALRFSRAAFSEPGRFTSSVPPRVPATARESIACGVICRLA